VVSGGDGEQVAYLAAVDVHNAEVVALPD
jgi:hypothetical protein